MAENSIERSVVRRLASYLVHTVPHDADLAANSTVTSRLEKNRRFAIKAYQFNRSSYSGRFVDLPLSVS